jgi:hypothetical protein
MPFKGTVKLHEANPVGDESTIIKSYYEPADAYFVGTRRFTLFVEVLDVIGKGVPKTDDFDTAIGA